MSAIFRIDVALTKNVMQIRTVDDTGHIVIHKALARTNFIN